MSVTVVNITFKRIQQFLFAVPRLKAMLGANALLGETIREDLVTLVKNHNGYEITEVVPPGNDSNDPLPLDDDNPQSLYEKGVISRDGGHFTAAFNDKDKANNFVQAAQAKIAEKLPGVMLEVTLETEGELTKQTASNQTTKQWGEMPTRLPQFQVCMDTGDEIANIKREETPEYIANKVESLEKAGKRFYDKNTNDIIGKLLKAGKLPNKDKKDKELQIPDDLKQLAGKSGYIAVIHADGNSMGIRRKLYAGQSEHKNGEPFNFKEYIDKEVKNEEFFHAMRVAVRKSVIEALHKVFTQDSLQKHKKLPYQLLMLGGDDLLLVTRPEYAFPFVIEYSKAIARIKIPYKDKQTEPMSIGAGIAIAHHNIPFYHLHHLAENLADSAKKLYRAQRAEKGTTPEERSVVDWLVATTSWIDDIEKSRREYDLDEHGNICTTAKPYFVLNKDDDNDSFSLQTLWEAAKNIAEQYQQDEHNQTINEEKLPRSKLKALLHPVTQFEIGDSEEYYKKIKPLPEALSELFGENAETLWHDIADKQLTQYKDLMELIEAHFLGQQTKSTDSQTDETDDNTTQEGNPHE